MGLASPLFSPLLFAGFLAKPLPLAPLNIILAKVADKLLSEHPDIAKRLEPIAGINFLIIPADLPFSMMLSIKSEGEIAARFYRDDSVESDVKISGSFINLLKMLDGEIDGDALFFSRELTVEGDTEALLTLRNALDGDDINIMQEMIASLGIFSKPVAKATSASSLIMGSIQDDMNLIQETLLSGVEPQLDGLDKKVGKLQERVASLETQVLKHQKKLGKK